MWAAVWPDWEESQDFRVAVYYPDNCLYLPGRSRRVMAMDHPNIERLMLLGGQRFGNEFCWTVCPSCQACIPSRIRVSEFQLSRSQQRTLRRNPDVRLEVGTVIPTREKIRLFREFLKARFDLVYDQFEDPTRAQNFYHQWLMYRQGGTREFRYFLGDRLLGVGAVDAGESAGYSHYFFYDPGFPRRRLGVMSFLREIQWCQETGREFLYIGFYNGLCRSMNYKREFSGLELLLPDRGWVPAQHYLDNASPRTASSPPSDSKSR